MASPPPGASAVRIVTLLPSATEIVCAAGAERMLVGRSHECDFPSTVQHLPVLTAAKNGAFTSSREVHEATCQALDAGAGLYTVDAELLEQLRPTLVVTQDLCSVCSVDLRVVTNVLKQSKLDPKPAVLSLNPASLEDVLQDMLRVGQHTGTLPDAQAAVDAHRARVRAVAERAQELGPPKLRNVAFLEWTDPLFCGGHWTPALIELAGGTHPLNLPAPQQQHMGGGGDQRAASSGTTVAAAAAAAGPSFALPPEALVASDPDVIIICPCGLDLDMGRREAQAMARNAWWKELRAVKQGAVFLVDGNAHFNRPGPRLLDAAEFLLGVLHERWELIPKGFEFELLQLTAGDGDGDGDAQGGDNGDSAQQRASSSEQGPVGATPAPALADAGADDAERQELLRCAEREPPAGTRCAPHLPPDVEECYATALAAGRQQYKDPVTGFQCFTELALRQGRSCCGNRCRHCPLGHFRVNPGRRGPRVNRVTEPTVMPGGSASSAVPRVTLLAVAAAARGGGKAAAEAALEQAGRRVRELQARGEGGGAGSVMALVAVDPASRTMWRAAPGGEATGNDGDEDDDALSAWMDFCVANKMSMVAVPVRVAAAAAAAAAGGLAGVVEGVVREAVAALAAQSQVQVQGLAWADEGGALPGLPWLPAALRKRWAGQAGGWQDVATRVGLAHE